jgi:two-component system response regulator FixJ
MNEQTIHIVDDDSSILASTSIFLTAKGFGVRIYDSAPCFLTALGSNPTGCVVTDILMPGMNGLELISKIRDHSPAIPIIVITAHAETLLALAAMRQGAVDLLEKPFRNTALVAAITDALTRRRSENSKMGPDLDSARKRLSHLTIKEKEVMNRLLEGASNKAIANELNVNCRIIEIHRASLMAKMNASNIVDLAKISLIASRLC